VTRRIVSLAAIAISGALAGAGCAVDVDSGPRPVDPELLEQGAPTPRSAITPGGAVPMYLLAPADDGQGVQLRTVGRDTDPTPLAIMTALTQGPTDTEVATRLRSALPTGLRVLSVRVNDSVLALDVSAELQDVSSDELVQAVAQVVFTATSLPGIDAVAISVDGVARQWPAGDGVLLARPLTRYDYPGFLPSAQPPYPPLPSRQEDLVVEDEPQPKNTSATS
jgi:spore germination protein GerM